VKTVAQLERVLAEQETGPWAPALLAELDELEQFPDDAVAVLDDSGLAGHYVLTPESDFRETVWLIRAIARRDLTVAIAHGKTFLGAAPVWVAGTAEQGKWLAARIRGGNAVCWALTERDHGSDLLAGEVTAVETEDGWRLDGEKWLINNATRARFACVFARTGDGGGRGFSLFLVDKERLSATTWEALPKVRTHGIRGADISGIAFHGAEVTAGALVGTAGDGVGIVLKSLQLTRIACGALSLGAADHALRLAKEFVGGRELYGRGLAQLPHVRRVLGQAATTALVAEAVSVLATRSVHALPGELSVTSAITKAYVPLIVQDMLASLAELLGARGFLTSLPGGGFAKLERDHRICGIFDGSTVVNRTALLNQMARLGRSLRRRKADEAGVRAASTLDAVRTAFDPSRLSLMSAGGCSVVQSLPGVVERVRAAGNPELTRLADLVLAGTLRLEEDLADFVAVAGGLPSSAFALAERYEKAYAAASCMLLWLNNSAGRAGPLWTEALWLRAGLTGILGISGDEVFDAMASVVLAWSAPEFSVLDGAV
jgi:alkylation response protein AidB-like acyl-CoA dehydrogenase